MFLLPTLDLTALCKQKPSQSNGIVGAGNHLKDVESSGLETPLRIMVGNLLKQWRALGKLGFKVALKYQSCNIQKDGCNLS